jgi:hypothetical protein
MILGEAVEWNVGTFGDDANGEVASGMNHKDESTKATPGGGASRSSNEVRESGWSEGDACSGAKSVRPTSNGRSLKDKAKSYSITRTEVLEAYFKVKSNKGAAGIDDQTIADFESNLERNLYRVWNRMSSGSYFPPPVRTVMIPKANGGKRALGIPTAAFRDGVPEGIGVSVGVLVEGQGSEFLSVVCRGSRALQERLSSRGLLLHVTATRENVWQYSK